MKSNEKWVLVTGASTGIGRATAECLALNKFKVYAGARKQKDLDELSNIKNLVPIKLDITNDQDVSDLVKFINERKTGLFALINNAGIAKGGPLMDLPIKNIKEHFEINLFGVHRVTQALFPFLYESKGRIVMISSDSGFFATPFFGPYCSSKFALEGYSDSLRRELLLYGVKVIIIEPGRITTPIWDKGEDFLKEIREKESIFRKEAIKIGEYAIKKGKTAGLNPIEVGKLIYKALIAKKPKIRYLIAPSRMKYWMIKYFLTARKVDNMIKKELSQLKSE